MIGKFHRSEIRPRWNVGRVDRVDELTAFVYTNSLVFVSKMDGLGFVLGLAIGTV